MARLASEQVEPGAVLTYDMGDRPIHRRRPFRAEAASRSGDTLVRRGRPAWAAVALALVAAGTLGRASAGAPSAPHPPANAPADAVAGRALVRFRAGTPASVQQLAHARAGAAVVRTIGGAYQLVSFPAQLPLSSVLASYANDPAVTVAEPDYVARVALTPSDPCSSNCSGATQYSLALTNALNGWSVFPGKTYDAAAKSAITPVTIAVLDTKIDQTNPDFANAGSSSTDAAHGGQIDAADGRDWIPPSQQTGSAAYHGTYVAGIAAAATGNGRDVAAIGYAARVMPLTVVGGNGTADAAALADGIVYAWQHGARVINLSLGLVSDSQAVHDAIIRVTTGANPALVVAAAGNNTGNAPFYPGSYRESMAVAGTGATDGRASCSNYNGNVSVSAPAEKVLSLAPMPSEMAAAPCGTSAATPQVSALAALLFAQNAARTPAEVRRIIETTADDLGPGGRDDYFGNGRINVERALRYGDGSPVATLPRATMPPASGGPSTITAVATSPRGIRGAEVRIDSPAATPLALSAADGAFGGITESLRGTVTVPASMPAGAHVIYVRAFDGTTWGPATTGVLLIDRTAPSLTGLAASNAVRAAGQPASVTFTSVDNLSPVIAYAIVVTSAVDGHVVFQDVRQWVGGGQQRYDWLPGADVLPGRYTVKVIVGDPAGNHGQTLTTTNVA
jgi:Subtilase family